MPAISNLQPGDCLLYKPASIFGWVIFLKTWHPIAHIEIYKGNDHSWASRDGLGVGLYPTRLDGLTHILRPIVPLDLEAANAWAAKQIGTPYGWLELLNFIGLPIDVGGQFCSQFATLYLRQARMNIFPTEAADQIAPFEFQLLDGALFKEVQV